MSSRVRCIDHTVSIKLGVDHIDISDTYYRFGVEANKVPDLYRQPRSQQIIMAMMLALPGQKQRYANLHARYWDTPWSPFVSLTDDLDRIVMTHDRRLASVISGYPNARIQSPYIFVYENIPPARLIRPDADVVPAAGIEGEILYIGRGIANYLVETRPNPFKPGDTMNFRPRSN